MNLNFEINRFSPVYIALFIFPVLVVSVQSGGSVIYALFLLAGLILGWSEFKNLSRNEIKVFVGFMLFFLVTALSLINTQDMESGYKKLGRFIHFPLLLPMYLLIKKYQLDIGKSFLLGMIVAALVMSGQAIYQTEVLNWHRAVGAYNSLVLGGVSMAVMALLISALLTVAKQYRDKIVLSVAIITALIASYLSGARGAWLLLPMLPVWFLIINYRNIKPKYVIGLVVFCSLLLVGVSNLKIVGQRVSVALQQFQEYSEGKSSQNGGVTARFEMWSNSVRMWKAHPVIGTGAGDYFNDTQALIDSGESKLFMAFSHSHSIYFHLLATTGSLGFIAMILFLQILPFSVFYSFWKKQESPWFNFYSLAGMTTIIAFAVFGLTEAWIVRSAMIKTYLICILVFMSGLYIRRPDEFESHKS